jgi:hypothetical protein
LFFRLQYWHSNPRLMLGNANRVATFAF